MPLILGLAACNTPGPEFRGIPATTVTIDGSSFDVRVKKRRAQAIRTNVQYAPRLGRLEFSARAAMEQVSGCSVTKIKGDAAVVVGSLRCRGQPKLLPDRPGALECVALGSIESAATNERITDFDCTWVD